MTAATGTVTLNIMYEGLWLMILWVMIDDHIHAPVNKANKMLCFICRIISCRKIYYQL